MAFVYRTMNDDQGSKCQTPGPGAYFNARRYQKQKDEQCRVPFNQSQHREIWKKTTVPGPGTYQSQSTIKKQKKLASDATGEIAIYESPLQSMAFKSKTLRFGDSSNLSNPGPGQYEAPSLKPKPSSASKLHTRSSGTELKEFLRKKNQAAQPRNESAQVQKEIIVNANTNLSLIENENQKQTDTIKSNKTSGVFASKVERQVNKVRPQTSLGPGSYNINKSSFKVEKNYEKKTMSKSISVEKKASKEEDLELGPGYYEVDRAFKNLSQGCLMKKKKLECFGSTVDRFKNSKGDIKNSAPGPAYYEFQNKQSVKQLKKQSIKTTFPKEQRVIFNSRPQSPTCPMQYQTNNNEKYKRKPSVKECFGSTKSRFEQKETVKNQQEQQYYSSIKLFCRDEDQSNLKISREKKAQRKSFKNLLKKNQQNGLKQYASAELELMMTDWTMFRPFCYDAQTNTLQSKYSKKVQKQAPFMSCAQRFKGNNNSSHYIDLQSDPKNKSQQQQFRNGSNKKARYPKSTDKKLGWMAVSKDSRFKYEEQKEKNKQLGPQYYNPVKPQKKSYNVLFK